MHKAEEEKTKNDVERKYSNVAIPPLTENNRLKVHSQINITEKQENPEKSFKKDIHRIEEDVNVEILQYDNKAFIPENENAQPMINNKR